MPIRLVAASQHPRPRRRENIGARKARPNPASSSLPPGREVITMRRVIYMGLAAAVLAVVAPASADDDSTRGTKRVRVQNQDKDEDRAVSTTRTTSFAVGGPNEPATRPDVLESRAEARREV